MVVVRSESPLAEPSPFDESDDEEHPAPSSDSIAIDATAPVNTERLSLFESPIARANLAGADHAGPETGDTMGRSINTRLR
ncbi:MAG: hypothetical protein M9952_10345 [Microthrixaceae bacterium]|nr:hypothetical protein [Microthrixaceae bacterium]MCO5313315.1 hypothetical protein [Microthrixaceae bacterium]HPB45769.1 hypothetical protein [Microthrixaceae bacterium]